MSKINKDQIYANAISKCEKVITLEFIKEIVADDKTDTIKKYFISYGPLQLAFHLQSLARTLRPPKNLQIGIEEPRRGRNQFNDDPDGLSAVFDYAKKYGLPPPSKLKNLPNDVYIGHSNNVGKKKAHWATYTGSSYFIPQEQPDTAAKKEFPIVGTSPPVYYDKAIIEQVIEEAEIENGSVEGDYFDDGN